MTSPLSIGSLAVGKVVVSAVVAAHLAGCAPRAMDSGSAVSADPFGLFRDVCGQIGATPEDNLVIAIETRGLKPVRAADAPWPFHGLFRRVYADRKNGGNVFIALQRRGAVCTVAARRAEVGRTLQRFSEYMLDQAAPDRTVARTAGQEPADDEKPVRAAFRVTPRPTAASWAHALVYTFSGDPSATADAQVVLRAELAPSSP